MHSNFNCDVKKVSRVGIWLASFYIFVSLVVMLISVNINCYFCDPLIVIPLIHLLPLMDMYTPLGRFSETTLGYILLIVVTAVLLYLIGWIYERIKSRQSC